MNTHLLSLSLPHSLSLSASICVFSFFVSCTLLLSLPINVPVGLPACLHVWLSTCQSVNLSNRYQFTHFFTIPSPTSLLLKSPHTYIPSSVMLLSLYFLNTCIPFFFPLFFNLFPPPSLSILSSHLFLPYLLSLSSSYLKFLSFPLISSALISFPLFFNLPAPDRILISQPVWGNKAPMNFERWVESGRLKNKGNEMRAEEIKGKERNLR